MFGMGKNKEDGVVYHNLIEVSRTKTVDYQAVRIAVGFNCPPSVNYSDGFRLAEFMVETRINGKYYREEADSFAALYAAVFPGDTIEKYLKEFRAIKGKSRRSGFFELA